MMYRISMDTIQLLEGIVPFYSEDVTIPSPEKDGSYPYREVEVRCCS
jgi:hypothetical protein